MRGVGGGLVAARSAYARLVLTQRAVSVSHAGFWQIRWLHLKNEPTAPRHPLSRLDTRDSLGPCAPRAARAQSDTNALQSTDEGARGGIITHQRTKAHERRRGGSGYRKRIHKTSSPYSPASPVPPLLAGRVAGGASRRRAQAARGIQARAMAFVRHPHPAPLLTNPPHASPSSPSSPSSDSSSSDSSSSDSSSSDSWPGYAMHKA